MDDKSIIELYFSRSESAIEQTKLRYGRYLSYIARNILGDEFEAEECVNDALLSTWGAIPPSKPRMLSTFIGKITRNIAIDRYRKRNAEKRSGRAALVLDEISEIVSSSAENEETLTDGIELRDALNSFLRMQKRQWRIVFVQRYFYSMSVSDIAAENGLTEGNVKLILHRMRVDLREFFTEREIEI